MLRTTAAPFDLIAQAFQRLSNPKKFLWVRHSLYGFNYQPLRRQETAMWWHIASNFRLQAVVSRNGYALF
ncbi:MAG: hypothetical protein NZ703_07080 [Gemmataceae bacterium]|nr:hypothetical protein [Gemmataceae bacterium]